MSRPAGFLRARDEVLAAAPDGDPGASTLAGGWVNTSSAPQSLSRLFLPAPDGEAKIGAQCPRGAAFEWWQASDRVLYSGISTPEIIAVTARLGFGAYDALLQGNLNLGLLVLGIYKRFHDGRVGFFSREFFSREANGGPPAADLAGATELFSSFEPPDALELAPILGRWRNTDRASRGIAEIHVSDGADRVRVRAIGAGSDGAVDWGEAESGVYACVDEGGAPSLSLLASYRRAELRSELQLRVIGGTLALANFNHFTAGAGPRSYFTREFFYRVDERGHR